VNQDLPPAAIYNRAIFVVFLLGEGESSVVILLRTYRKSSMLIAESNSHVTNDVTRSYDVTVVT